LFNQIPVVALFRHTVPALDLLFLYFDLLLKSQGKIFGLIFDHFVQPLVSFLLVYLCLQIHNVLHLFAILKSLVSKQTKLFVKVPEQDLVFLQIRQGSLSQKLLYLPKIW